MTDIEKALELFYMTEPFSPNERLLYDAGKVLAAAYKAEKKRADDLEAENARLREELEPLIKILDPEPFGTLSGMGSLDKRLEWYDKMRPLRESARKALTPSTPSHNGEIDPTHADYGCFKTRNEFPS